MAYTQSDLTAIERAIASGTTTVQFQDRMVVYRSMSELMKTKAEIVASLTARKRMTLGVADKGFRS